MNVDVQALGRFNRLAHEGAEHAADSLSQLTEVTPSVEATRIDLISKDGIGETFEDSEFVGVEIGLSGGLCGKAVLAFDRDGAETVVGSLPAGGDLGTEAGITEIGNILLSGFIDGWGDHLGTTVDITPPSFVSGSGSDVTPDDAPTWDDHQHVFAFTSQIEAEPETATAQIFMFPDSDSFERLVAAEASVDSAPIPIEKLTTFNRMTRQGASKASEHISMMTGIETTVSVSQISFAPIETVPRQLKDTEYVGVVLEFSGLPSGYLLILFDEPSARSIAGSLVPGDGEGELGEMEKSAIQEIGNITTSGFIDGWANVLGTSIEHTPPQLVHDMGQAIMDPIAVELARTQEFAFVIDSTIETEDREIECELYALPDERELTRALSRLDVEPTDDAENPFPGMEASYEDL